MGWLDYLLLGGVIALVVFAVWLSRTRNKKGGCHGCDGNCPECRKKEEKRK